VSPELHKNAMSRVPSTSINVELPLLYRSNGVAANDKASNDQEFSKLVFFIGYLQVFKSVYVSCDLFVYNL